MLLVETFHQFGSGFQLYVDVLLSQFAGRHVHGNGRRNIVYGECSCYFLALRTHDVQSIVAFNAVVAGRNQEQGQCEGQFS